MIVVDSSVWINHLRGLGTPGVVRLRSVQPDDLLVGDVILIEVLRGLRSERQALDLQRKFLAYGVTPMLGADLAFRGAAHYRRLRADGITIRKLGDLIIATYCIEHGHQLLHEDRDFDHFERHLGLKVLH